MQADNLVFQLSEADEQVVRTYECTRFQPWFRPPTSGYLTVTNKRIVFHSTGKSLTGRSLLTSEMPLEDAAGLSMYEGLSVNWPLFVVFCVVAYVLTEFIAGTLPGLLVSYQFALLLMAPFAALWLLSSNVLNDALRRQILDSVANASQGKVTADTDLSAYLAKARLPLFVGLAIFAWRVGFAYPRVIDTPFVNWVVLVAAYALVFFNTFGRRPTFSMQIGSRTMKDSGIYIPGDTLRLIGSHDATAMRALGASPAADAPRVFRELGALLLDMQQMGDLAMAKWKVS